MPQKYYLVIIIIPLYPPSRDAAPTALSLSGNSNDVLLHARLHNSTRLGNGEVRGECLREVNRLREGPGHLLCLGHCLEACLELRLDLQGEREKERKCNFSMGIRDMDVRPLPK